VTKDQLAVLEKLSLPPLPALSEHELHVGQDESPLLTNVDDKIRRTVMDWHAL